ADLLGLLRPLTGSERWDFFRWRNPGVWWRSTWSTVASLYRTRRQGTVRKLAGANWMKLQPDWRDGHFRNILVICHGNICRSPTAARLLAGPGLEVKSAGFLGAEGRAPPPDWAGVVERTLEIDLRGHRPAKVDALTIEWADLILVMDVANWHALSKAFPAAMDKVALFGVAAEVGADMFEIPDPFDLEEEAMCAVAKTLESCARALLDQRIACPIQPVVPRSAPA
ncbi:MAG TPA: hypothetical protein VJ722_09590, partial [Rhodanobacteraceae bacterium]|nr:hypothetical protein [Rhodanobacteraceae bacterium]